MLAYLDDLLIIAQTAQQCLNNLQIVISVLRDHGWIINEIKSRMIPAQVFQWLGVSWDLTKFQCSVPQDTQLKLVHSLIQLRNQHYISKRMIMQVQGLTNWCSLTDHSFKPLISVTRNALSRMRKWSLDFPFQPSLQFKMDLIAFQSKKSFPLLLGVPDHYLNIMTDTSGEGWGIKFPLQEFSGVFDLSLRQFDIAVKELLTIFWALLLVQETETSVLVHTDSLVSLQVLRKGYSKNPILDQLAMVVWRHVLSRSINLHLSFLPGNYNVRADQLSRGLPISTEWSISKEDFDKILQLVNFVPQIDLFATDLNHKVDLYMSPCPDHQAVAVDAMNNSWDKWDYLYLFPPNAMISKALAKLRASKFREALLVCPELVGRPWFHSLQLFHVTQFRLYLILQQTVNGVLVRQDHPTNLIVCHLLGDLSAAVSRQPQSS